MPSKITLSFPSRPRSRAWRKLSNGGIMAKKGDSTVSAFAEKGLKKAVTSYMEELADLYLSDEIPWVVGYSGGKDSTATLQLVCSGLAAIPEDPRQKPF